MIGLAAEVLKLQTVNAGFFEVKEGLQWNSQEVERVLVEAILANRLAKGPIGSKYAQCVTPVRRELWNPLPFIG